MAADASTSVEAYLGCFISLTTMFEIRYQGVVSAIDTRNATIGLNNVRSFGTEGRKKDGPQIPPGDEVYEYVLFRGSEIKELQVQFSPPAQLYAPIHHDQTVTQYSHPAFAPTNTFSGNNGIAPDIIFQASRSGGLESALQSGVPVYQTGNSGYQVLSGPQISANSPGMGMPSTYWQGFYGPATGHQPIVHLPAYHPPDGVTISPFQEQGQLYGIDMPLTNPNFPDAPSSLIPSVSLPTTASSFSSLNSTARHTAPSILPPITPLGAPPFPVLDNASITPKPSITSTTNLPLGPPFITTWSHDARSGVISSLGVNSQAYLASELSTQTVPQSIISNVQPPPTKPNLVPPLATPGKLLNSVADTPSASKALPTVKEEAVVIQPVLSKPASFVDKQEHIQQFPTPNAHRVTANAFSPRHCNYRGSERISQTVTRFTEDFDFSAMNEKFNKDEVWGQLGKNKGLEGDGNVAVAVNALGDHQSLYLKDDFFDSLSRTPLEQGVHRRGRMYYDEQVNNDAETFGYVGSCSRGYGGGHGLPRGGGRGRGSYYGGRYGYMGRGPWF